MPITEVAYSPRITRQALAGAALVDAGELAVESGDEPAVPSFHVARRAHEDGLMPCAGPFTNDALARKVAAILGVRIEIVRSCASVASEDATARIYEFELNIKFISLGDT